MVKLDVLYTYFKSSSLFLTTNGEIAQVVLERWIHNPEVEGSTPSLATKKYHLPDITGKW